MISIKSGILITAILTTISYEAMAFLPAGIAAGTTPVTSVGGATAAVITTWQPSTAYEASSNAISYVYVPTSNNTYRNTATTCTSTTGSGPTGTGTGITDGTCSWNYVAAGKTFIVPANFLSTIAVVAVGGGGSSDNGLDYFNSHLTAGGGGAYAAVTSFSTSASASVTYQAGVGGAALPIQVGVPSFGNDGTASWFAGASCGAATVCADFGRGGGDTGPAGTGGLAGNSIGTSKFSGGDSGQQISAGAPGGGGAGGPLGAGGTGGNAPDDKGGGGGAANGGTAGGEDTVVGGNGGTVTGGTGGTGGQSDGTAVVPATGGNGGGGAYPYQAATVAGNGSCVISYGTLYGPGSGGGGGSGFAPAASPPGNGCGGGGGGGVSAANPGFETTGSKGGDGFVVFYYNHS